MIVATKSKRIRALSETTEDQDHPPPGRARHVGPGIRQTLPDPPGAVAHERVGPGDSPIEPVHAHRRRDVPRHSPRQAAILTTDPEA